jgi:hypothetical protein
MVAASELGSERVSNGREHMSQRGKRASFNGATGRSDIEGKAARVAVSKRGRERVSIRKGKHTEAKMKNAICRGKNKTVVEYTLRDAKSPIGVAEYRLLPPKLKAKLPAVRQLKDAVTGVDAADA